MYLPCKRKYVVLADVTFHEDLRFFDALSSSSMPLPKVVLTNMLVSASDLAYDTSHFHTPILSLPPLDITFSPQSSSLSHLPSSKASSSTAPARLVSLQVSSPAPNQSSSPLASPTPRDLHFPIALCKGTQSCTLHPNLVCHSCTPYLIDNVVSYDYLSPKYYAFTLSLVAESIPMSHVDAMMVPH